MPGSSDARKTSRRVRSQRAAEVAALHARVAQLEAALKQAVDRNGNLEVEAGQLRAMLAAVPVWVSYIDREQRYRSTNWAGSDTGSDPTDKPNGRLVSEVLDEEIYRAIQPDLERSLRGELVVRDRTVPLRGERVASFRATYTPHLAADGTVDGVVVVVGRAEDLGLPAGPHFPADETPPPAAGGAAPKGALP